MKANAPTAPPKPTTNNKPTKPVKKVAKKRGIKKGHHNEDNPKLKLCGATLRPQSAAAIEKWGLRDPDQTTCRNIAGLRTKHPGYGRCFKHGGNMQNFAKAAEKEMVLERIAKDAKLFGGHRNIGPHEALLEEVQRTAGHVLWLENKIATMGEDEFLTQRTAKDGMKESEWVKMYQEERKMLVAVCNTAIRAGIAERQIKIAEDQGKLIAGAFIQLINDTILDLSPEQRLYAPKLVRNLLLQITSGQEATQTKQVIGNEIVDAEIIEEAPVYNEETATI